MQNKVVKLVLWWIPFRYETWFHAHWSNVTHHIMILLDIMVRHRSMIGSAHAHITIQHDCWLASNSGTGWSPANDVNLGLTLHILVPGRCGTISKSVIFYHMLYSKFCGTSSETAFRWMSQNTFDIKSALIQVIAWGYQTLIQVIAWGYQTLIQVIAWGYQTLIQVIAWGYQTLIQVIAWGYQTLIQVIAWGYQTLIQVIAWGYQTMSHSIEGEDIENPLIYHIMNLLWSLSDKGTRVRFCWVPSHCGIDGNERVDQLAKETLDRDIDPLASVHYTDMKLLVNSYIQKLVQTRWDVAVHGRDLYLVKPTLGLPKKFWYLTRAEEVVITRLRIGHTKATKSHILSRGPPTGCHHCGKTLTIDHMLLECALLQECRDEYYTVDSLNTVFETIPETCIVVFLREARFFFLIWCNFLTSTSP